MAWRSALTRTTSRMCDCIFEIDFYDYDEGDLEATVTFTGHAANWQGHGTARRGRRGVVERRSGAAVALMSTRKSNTTCRHWWVSWAIRSQSRVFTLS